MEPIKLSDREYVTLVAGYEPSDEEIHEFLAEYEDWLYCFENTACRRCAVSILTIATVTALRCD